MTPTLPRPIEPGEIRVGDRVRITWTKYDVEVTAEFTVGSNSDIDRKIRTAGDGPYQQFAWSPGTWTLLAEARIPAPAVGSRWRDPVTNAEYVATGSPLAPYVGYTIGCIALRLENPGAIARLTPIPDHSDGCSPWLWDKETDTGWVDVHLQDSQRTHAQVSGYCTHDGELHPGYDGDRAIAQRLVPWSERGQANG